MAGEKSLMKKATREWLRNLKENRNNSKAIEIQAYIERLELESQAAPNECGSLHPMESAPKDGSEILAYHIESRNLHPIVWADRPWIAGFIPRWGMRWNEEYSAYDGCYKGWIPYPVISMDR